MGISPTIMAQRYDAPLLDAGIQCYVILRSHAGARANDGQSLMNRHPINMH